MTSLIVVQGLKKYYTKSSGWIESIFSDDVYIKAVDDVNFSIDTGEIVSIVGESGCGKTTLGKAIIRLEEITEGKIFFKNTNITSLSSKEMHKLRREVQIIYQDPFSSLNPKKTIHQLVVQPLKIHNIGSAKQQQTKVEETLSHVGLTPVDDFLNRYPEELSGGQLQRVSFARALVLDPDFVVADEPTSMLDASVRARILDLIEQLNDKHNVSFLVITHDLSAARYISDRIGVMYLGRLVELGNANDVFENPKHPYSKALIDSIPTLSPHEPFLISEIEGEIPDPENIPDGCSFHPRCPIMKEHCKTIEPEWRELPRDEKDQRHVACHEVEPKFRKESN